MIEEKKTDDIKQCKAILKTTGHRCSKDARLNGYCMIHYVSLSYKENKKLKRELKAKEKIEREKQRSEARQKKSEERRKKWK